VRHAAEPDEFLEVPGDELGAVVRDDPRRGVQMDEDILQAVAKLREEVPLEELDLSVLDKYRGAA